MRSNKSKRKMHILIIVLFIMFVGIGYAILTQQLTINNTINYVSMTWDVGFTATSDNGGSVTSISSISTDKKSITISCDIGTSISSETCIVKATITNASTFNVMLSEAPTITYDDTYISSVDATWIKSSLSTIALDGIASGKSEDIQIKIITKELTEDMLPSSALSIPITITMNWIEADGTEKIVGDETSKLVEIISGDGTKVGDELKIGEEHFYVVSNDGTNAVLLSKYNLEVGKKYTGESGSWNLVEIENPSGLQNDKSLGYVDYDSELHGVVPFSSTNYWYSNSLKSEYGTSYPAYVYDDNASIKTYVDNYAEYLEELGLTIKEARLIKQEELVELGCRNSSCVSAPSWVYSTTYWSGSASSGSDVWYVYSDDSFAANFYNSDFEFGVRPVIVIPSFEI